jgi:outer membrane protein TolC
MPQLPQSIAAMPDIERALLAQRIDLRLMRREIDELAARLGLSRATRFIDVLDVGPARVRQGPRSQPYEKGYELSLEIPLFDGGAARVKKAEAIYAQAVDRFTQAAIEARSQIRLAYARYQAAFEMAARQRDEVLPTGQLIAEQNLLRYNASLISVFDLLADARDRVIGVDAYLQGVRDFWMAKSALDAALLCRSALSQDQSW